MVVKIKESQERMKKYHRRNHLRNKKRDDRKGYKLETTWSSMAYTVYVVKGKILFTSATMVKD